MLDLHVSLSDTLVMKPTLAIEKAAQIIGSQEKLGAIFGLKKAAVTHWKRSKCVPAEYCARIETETGISRKWLRPKDWQKYWPDLAPTKPTTEKAGV